MVNRSMNLRLVVEDLYLQVQKYGLKDLKEANGPA